MHLLFIIFISFSTHLYIILALLLLCMTIWNPFSGVEIFLLSPSSRLFHQIPTLPLFDMGCCLSQLMPPEKVAQSIWVVAFYGVDASREIIRFLIRKNRDEKKDAQRQDSNRGPLPWWKKCKRIVWRSRPLDHHGPLPNVGVLLAASFIMWQKWQPALP